VNSRIEYGILLSGAGKGRDEASALTSVPGNSNQIAEVSPGKAGKGVNRRESAASAVASLSGRHAYVSLE